MQALTIVIHATNHRLLSLAFWHWKLAPLAYSLIRSFALAVHFVIYSSICSTPFCSRLYPF